MLDDFNTLELENFEHQLYSQVHHLTCAEKNVSQLDPESEMPPRKVSYRPVRYFPRKKNKTASHLQDQQRPKKIDSLNNRNSEQNKGQTSQIPEKAVHPYPINNILVFPQNSDTLINVISQNTRDFSYKKIFRKLRRQNQKNKFTWKNMQNSNHDVKPIISEINIGNNRKQHNLNRHTIILSDSEDDTVGVERIENNQKTLKSFDNICENATKNLTKDDKTTLCIDDDVILVETQPINDVIEIDDHNTEQMPITSNHKSDEHNELLSTPESSTSNDFLENSQLNPNSKFNFSLHGSEFKDTEFLRPTINVDISESGSVSSISDISSSMKTNVFNVVEFPKEKENLFDENNIEKFKNSITPQRCNKKSIIEDHENLNSTADEIFSNNQLPTLSDIRTDENSHIRVRGRSIIRELVNDRAYVLLSSAEKKMKTKKRKSRDYISDTIVETDLSENTSEMSKKKKKKKTRKKEVNLDGEDSSYIDFTENNFSTSSLDDTNVSKKKKYNSRNHDKVDKNEDYDNVKHSSRIMIRTDLFSDINVTAHGKNKKENTKSGGEILGKSEVTTRNKKKKMSSKHIDNSSDRSKKDKLVSGYNEETAEYAIVRKSDKNEKKHVQHGNVERIECSDELNITLVEKKRKRKKDKSTSESEIIDHANDETISTNDCSISKNKYKRKRLSENEKVKDNQMNKMKECGMKPERIMKQKTLSTSEISSEVLHANHENSQPLINLSESINATTCSVNMEIVNENEHNITKSKHKKMVLSENDKNDKSNQVEVLGSRVTSDKIELSFKSVNMQRQKHLLSSEFPLDQNQAIAKLQSIENQDRSPKNIDIENESSIAKNYPIFKEIIENSTSSTALREFENNNAIVDEFISFPSNKLIFPEVISNSSGLGEKDCNNTVSAEKSHSVWNVCPTKFFSSSESLFTVSSIGSETHAKNICNIEVIEKLQDDNNFTASSISSTLEVDTSKVISPEPISENLIIDLKPLNETLVSNYEIIQSTDQNLAQLSDPKSLKSSDVANSKIISLPVKVKIEDSTNNHLQDENNHLDVAVLDEATENCSQIADNSSEQVIEQVVLKIETESSDRLDNKEKRDLNLSTPMKSNLPSVSSSIKSERELDASTLKEKLPDVIKKMVSKKDNVTSMRKLCEFLEEVNDPRDVLKKVSMIKEAFSATAVVKSVNTLIEEHVNDEEDILSISSDTSSVVCLEGDSSVIDIMDDINLINCELGNTPVTRGINDISEVEKLLDKDTILVDNCSEKEANAINLDDIDNQDETEKHESKQMSSISKYSEAGSYKRGLNKYEVEDIQSFMSDDLKLWKICSDDLPQRRHQPKGKRCLKCREIGHLGNSCPNKSNLPKCILCGLAGHLDFKCPSKICTQCGRKSPIMQSICQYCKHYRTLTCSVCKMKGHPRHKCPDLWRRYHLTVEHGPLVKLEGAKLKEKENLWCSSCAHSGHLEHYCFSAQRNRNFQQLDPSIHNYVDIYGVEVHSDNISKNTLPRKKTVVSSKKDNIPENKIDGIRNDSCDYTQNDFLGNKIPSELLQFHGNTLSKVPSNQTHTQSMPEVEKSQEVSVKSFRSPSYNVGVDDLPTHFAMIDEISNIALNHESFSELGTHVRVPSQLIAKDNEKNENITVRDISPLLNRKSNKSGPRKSTEIDELLHNSNNDTNSNSKSLPESQILKINKTDDFDYDCYNFFMKSRMGVLQKYIRDELALLQKTTFRVKKMFHKLLAFEKDDRKEKKISLIHRKKFYKELNMMFFGREHLRAGGVHYRKLEVFVNDSQNTLPISTKESLYYSYKYIFSKTKHSHVNYNFFMNLLLRKYKNKTI